MSLKDIYWKDNATMTANLNIPLRHCNNKLKCKIR